MSSIKVHLVDGTYELFRAHFALPSFLSPDGTEVAAVRGLMRTLLSLLRQEDVDHVGCAFDHVVESFRNRMFPGYKTGEGIPEDLMVQFPLAERAAASLGTVVWPMVEFEADDAIATAAVRFSESPEVDQVVICSPDKDLTQVVQGQRVVCLDRRRDIVLDEPGVLGKFGVHPESIPDYLGLVGDAADGIPGIPKWGAKTAATILNRYRHIEDSPPRPVGLGRQGPRGQWNRRQPGGIPDGGIAIPGVGHPQAGRGPAGNAGTDEMAWNPEAAFRIHMQRIGVFRPGRPTGGVGHRLRGVRQALHNACCPYHVMPGSA